jgi:hypothetical protein
MAGSLNARESKYCAEHGSNARFSLNVRFRLQAFQNLPQLVAAGFACPAAAPLGAPYPALSVGANKTGKILESRQKFHGARDQPQSA